MSARTPARSPTTRCPTARRQSPSSDVAQRDQRRALGRHGEQLAAEHLAQLGFSVLARNVRTRAGEIDLIAFDGRTLVFAEVKTLRLPAGVTLRPDHQPLQWLRRRQRARLRRLAVAWLGDQSRPRPTARAVRFDAIGVTVDTADRLVQLEHIEGAF